MTSAEAKTLLPPFLDFVKTLKGDEKSEAQTFLDRLFRALGHSGAKEAGATFEYRVAKKPGSSQLSLFSGDDLASAPKLKGGVKFADLLWPGRVLIEMKSRGEKLEKHYDQLFYYWSHIVPKRPPFAILCNFDDLWIYDFNEQLFDPVDRIRISELPKRYLSLGFLFRHQVKPLFENNRVGVTRAAADHLASVFRSLVKDRPKDQRIERERAQRFLLQMLVSFVSEDLNLFHGQFVTRLLDECIETGASSYDLFGSMFRQMNTAKPADGGRFKGVRYFNGGLFATIDPIDLQKGELQELRRAADQDWSQVRPEVFGTLFQHSMDAEERHAYGAHFTSEVDIHKVVGPTIVEPWRKRIETAKKDIDALMQVLRGLREFKVLDPACGSGNFLALAYREMKRLELEILQKLRELAGYIRAKGSKGYKTVPPEALMNAVSIKQFYGMDVLPFAAELAKVTLMVAKEMWIIENQQQHDSESLFAQESPLPLDNLDRNICCADALFTEWPKADAIIGNPPYLGARRATVEFGADYIKKVRKAFPGVPGRADFCVHWFKKAHDQLIEGARAGLVGTNTIRQNYSREGGLDYVVANGGTITDAVSTEVWSGDAAVHVSIVNWIKGECAEPKKLMVQLGDHIDSPWETHILPTINSSLSAGFDVSTAIPLAANGASSGCFQGQTHGHEGFLIERGDVSLLNQIEIDVLHPFLTGDDLLSESDSKPSRFVIDMNACDDIFAAKAYPKALEFLSERVMPTARDNAKKERESTKKEVGPRQTHFRRWWKFWRGREEMMTTIQSLPRYTVCVRHTKRPIFEFISPDIHPNDALQVFPFSDDYSFGIIQSPTHFEWFMARCSTLKGDFRYTSDTVFDTFPWPQEPTKQQIRAVADAAVALRQLRRDTMDKLGWSLRDLYRSLEEPGANPLRDAHAALDAAVRAAYGMGKNEDILTHLLALNHACAEKEKAGEKITPPGLPLPPEEHAAFITTDCIEAPKL